MQRWKPLCAILFVLTIGGRPALSADAAHTITIRLGWLTSGYQAPFYLAAVKGWYQKAGLDVTITPGTGSVTTTQLVGARQYDVGEVNLSNMIVARSKGVPLVSIACFFRTGDVALLVPVDSPVKGPADLKGKRIVISAGSFEQPLIAPFLAEGGLSESDVEFLNIDVNSRYAFYGQGGGDATFGSPQGTLFEVNKMRPSRALVLADWGLNIPGHSLAVPIDTLKEKGPALRAFASIVSGAWAYIEAGHEEEAIQAIVTSRPNDRYDVDELRQQLHASAPFLDNKLAAGLPIGVQSEAEWKDTLATMEKVHLIAPGAKTSDYYTNDYLDVATIEALGKS